MARPPFISLSLLLAVSLLPNPSRAESVDCLGGSVAVGDGKLDLLGKCGEPSLREERIEERSSFAVDPERQLTEEHRVRVTVERWTYNFGPNRFLQFVTIENGKIVAVQTGSYGYTEPKRQPVRVPAARCDSQLSFRRGDSSFEVLTRCGEPASRESKQVERRVAAADVSGVVFGDSTSVTVETWTYNFGTRSFQRKLKFIDGKLVKISTGNYGY